MREFVGPVPDRIAHLPTDKRGFPVPYFVAWIDGEPRFPVMDGNKLIKAVNEHRCWICGQTLGAYKCFVIGPMCGVNRISAEPPSHLECARFAVRNCPFMAMPLAKRSDVSDVATENPAGIMIERNPGCSLLWITKSFKVMKESNGILFRIGEPETVEFYAKGRKAKLPEVTESVRTGLPLLQNIAEQEGRKAIAALDQHVRVFNALLAKADLAPV